MTYYSLPSLVSLETTSNLQTWAQFEQQYRITMGPELLQRKLPLRVPTVALPSSDLSLSKSYEEGQRLVRGVVIFSWSNSVPHSNRIVTFDWLSKNKKSLPHTKFRIKAKYYSNVFFYVKRHLTIHLVHFWMLQVHFVFALLIEKEDEATQIEKKKQHLKWALTTAKWSGLRRRHFESSTIKLNRLHCLQINQLLSKMRVAKA